MARGVRSPTAPTISANQRQRDADVQQRALQGTDRPHDHQRLKKGLSPRGGDAADAEGIEQGPGAEDLAREDQIGR